MSKKVNELKFDGGETTLPDKIGQSIVTSKESDVSATSKFVFLAIKYIKSRSSTNFEPSYLFMKKRFGISSQTYNKALRQLNDIGAIEYHIINTSGGKKKVVVDILYGNDMESERIPSVIISTEVLTLRQKIFIILLWKLFYVDGKESTISTYYSISTLADKLSKIGVSTRTTYDRFNELSSPDSGFIHCIHKRADGGFSFRIKAISAMWEHEDIQWGPYKYEGGKKVDMPVYIKPKPGDFSFDGKKIIKKIT